MTIASTTAMQNICHETWNAVRGILVLLIQASFHFSLSPELCFLFSPREETVPWVHSEGGYGRLQEQNRLSWQSVQCYLDRTQRDTPRKSQGGQFKGLPESLPAYILKQQYHMYFISHSLSSKAPLIFQKLIMLALCQTVDIWTTLYCIYTDLDLVWQ